VLLITLLMKAYHSEPDVFVKLFLETEPQIDDVTEIQKLVQCRTLSSFFQCHFC